MMKRIMKAVLLCAVTLIMTAGFTTFAHAQEELAETQYSGFMKALQHVDAKAEPDDGAETVFSYDAGAAIYVTGETDDGWYIVFYQGETGYINKITLQGALETEEINIAALDEELEALQINDRIIIEEMERYQTEALRSRIWRAVIVILVIGIFAVGIISTIGTEKKKEEKNSPQDGQKKSNNEYVIDLDEE